MAQIIPAAPIQGSPPEVIRLFHLLKRLPDDVIIAQRLTALHGPGPDFWLTQADRVLFLAVAAITPQEAQRAGRLGLFGGDVRPVGEEAQVRLANFSHGIDNSPGLPTAVIFPNLNRKLLPASRPSPAKSE